MLSFFQSCQKKWILNNGILSKYSPIIINDMGYGFNPIKIISSERIIG